MKAAIVVGCSRYEDARIADLKYAHEDAVRFAICIGETIGVENSGLQLLSDSASDMVRRPSRGNVLRSLTALPELSSEPLDTLLFFFSGHGFHSELDQSDYLLTSDSIVEALEETSLRFEFILELLRRANSRHTLLFLDACRASTAGGKSARSAMQRTDVTNLTPSGMVSFCSCEPGSVSYEANELGGGIFTAALRDGLSEAGRCVTVQDLDQHLATTIPKLSRQTGKPLQRPHTRVEPLAVKDLELVTPAVRNMWRSSVRVGSERPRALRTRSKVSTVEDAMLAIDFGTTYSAIAVTDIRGSIRLLPGSDGRVLVPSVVSFTPELDYCVGSEAVAMEIHDASCTIRNVKRGLGTGRLVKVSQRTATPEFIASLIIRSLKEIAVESTGFALRNCLVSYPANFGLRQTNALLKAFELAGLHVYRMLGA